MKNYEIKKGKVTFVGSNIKDAIEASNPLADWQREFDGQITNAEIGESSKGNGFLKLTIKGMDKPCKILLFRVLTEWLGQEQAEKKAVKGFDLKDLNGLHVKREGLEVTVEEVVSKSKSKKKAKA